MASVSTHALIIIMKAAFQTTKFMERAKSSTKTGKNMKETLTMAKSTVTELINGQTTHYSKEPTQTM